jgi:hypothetical protein
MKKCSVYLLALAIPFIIAWQIDSAFAAEEASSIMCDNGVVNIGDTDTTVEATCGEPNSINYELNQWVYNFGPSQPVYTLIFKEGQLVKILADEWGS